MTLTPLQTRTEYVVQAYDRFWRDTWTAATLETAKSIAKQRGLTRRPRLARIIQRVIEESVVED